MTKQQLENLKMHLANIQIIVEPTAGAVPEMLETHRLKLLAEVKSARAIVEDEGETS